MTRVLAYPFRRAHPQRVACDPWQSHVGGAAGPLGAALPHWDYNVDLRLVRRVAVREAELRADCRLRPGDPVHAVVVWRSTGSTVRGRGAVVPLGGADEPREFTLAADVPGRLLSGDVVVSTQIVLAGAPHAPDALAPRFPGSVLWEDAVRVTLEGSASRFPMEVIDFNTDYSAPYGGAGWYLSWDSNELHEPLLRNVRLFVNSAHPAVVRAVQAAAPTPEQAAVRSAIYWDVGRQLVRGALDNDDFVADPHAYPDGSTGRAVLRMIERLFPAATAKGLRGTMRSNASYFDGMLQAAFQLFAPGLPAAGPGA